MNKVGKSAEEETHFSRTKGVKLSILKIFEKFVTFLMLLEDCLVCLGRKATKTLVDFTIQIIMKIREKTKTN